MATTNQAIQQPSNPETKPGWINTYYRYYKGKKLGPYYVRRWKENGKLCKEYIKTKDLERVRAECQLNREMQDSMNEAYRRRERFLDNGDFFLRMLHRQRRRKRIPLVHAAYLWRLDIEGMYITGRPSLRRKITRQVVEVDGKKMIRKTVFEFDGTTRDFMVPYSTKGVKSLRVRTCDYLLALLLQLVRTDHRLLSVSEIPDRRESAVSGPITDH